MENISRFIKTTTLVAVLVLGSKVLGLFRDVLIASNFGASFESDVFFIATNVSLVVSNMLALSIKTTLIPILTEIKNKEDERYLIKYVNNLINVFLVITLIIIVIMWLLTPQIVSIIAPGFLGSQFETAINLSRIGLPTVCFLVVSAIFTAFLHSNDRFGYSSFVTAPYNIMFILYLSIIGTRFGITGLMIASLFAGSTQIVIQLIPAVRLGYRYSFNIDIHDQYLQKIFLLMLSVFIGTMSQQINVVVSQSLASTLNEGSITALAYGGRLNGLLYNFFIIAATTVVFPVLSNAHVKNDYDQFNAYINRSITLVGLFSIPLSIGAYIFGETFVSILFLRGEFDVYAVKMTSNAFFYYTIGMIGYGITDIISKIFYSMKNTKIPMFASLFTVLINIILSFIFVKAFDYVGLALATSISGMSSALLLTILLKLSNNKFKIYIHFINVSKMLIASIVMGYFANFLFDLCNRNLFLSINVIFELLIILSIILLSVFLYFIVCDLLDIKEISKTRVIVLSKIKKVIKYV